MATSWVKRMLKPLVISRYQRWSNEGWNSNHLLHVAIECWPGFARDDWIEAIDREFPEWAQQVELRFIDKRVDGYALAPEMHVYASPWLTSDFVKLASELKWVHLAVGGVEFLEGIDLKPDLVITTSAGMAARGIAEHVIGLMISLDRRLYLARDRQQRWRWKQDGIIERIRGLQGRTVGVIGLGHNGLAVARLAKAIGMRVIGMAKHHKHVIEDLDVYDTPAKLPELLRESDFVVLCVPLNQETKGLIGGKELEMLGQDSYLINVSRGELVDEKALSLALRRGVVCGAALDVLSEEPPPRFHPLQRCPNLIITPHVAGNIYTFGKEIRSRFVCNLKAFLAGSSMEGLYQSV